MPGISSFLSRSINTHQIYGANTNVGKTIISTILTRAAALNYPQEQTWYLKPISTGEAKDADDSHVKRYTGDLPNVTPKCLWQYSDPVSPHLVAGPTPPSDHSVLSQVSNYLNMAASSGPGSFFLETAGGIHSPTLNRVPQADFYRPLRLPTILVADPHLGGISTSIAAHEGLHIRGYDTDAVFVFRDNYYRNHEYLQSHFASLSKPIPTIVLPGPPPRQEDSAEDQKALAAYYEVVSGSKLIKRTLEMLKETHEMRREALETLAQRAQDRIWWPFAQHSELLDPGKITTIDSAHGDFFSTLSPSASAPSANLLQQTHDASASWWTQGLGHANPQLTLAAAHAAGRYGHVMFANAIHEPALRLADSLLQTLRNPRFQRVFYSDNGSTGVEVALKMGMRAARVRYAWTDKKDVEVLGMDGNYHGDTMGAMDCSESNIFNESVEWHKGRGYWFKPPTVILRKGVWEVRQPSGEVETFEGLEGVMDVEKRVGGKMYEMYCRRVKGELEKVIIGDGRRFGAMIVEPIILGAGGMVFVDPLYQRALVDTVRSSTNLFSIGSPKSAGDFTPTGDSNAWTGLPIIFDEVFTGLYRLGQPTPSSFLGSNTHPDIGIYAKLLTGGLLPLSATCASKSIFEAFLSGKKEDALLHGHSYTAHAVGCEVACTSLEVMNSGDEEGVWNAHKEDWNTHTTTATTTQNAAAPWSVWSKSWVYDISSHPNVDGVIALGSVLAITLKTSEAGYASSAAQTMLARMREERWEELEGGNVMARPLGNVVYFMAGQKTPVDVLRGVQGVIAKVL
ncbi:PLP-dependent transferase [Saitoella complicata NRRL Y-17804]|uniref:Dethiobiotin synthase n=1 Tax=Saitoella complicata (strain BCRC 22490 / CBS 7301 / JCM 7358 / NBRC 10748 / NRRL Y-17804) TaxID=698492 RepID=A0A0E9NJ86_SAICN|nr:PLP-dependent transferase [Saitoella complicata NRRL Y-17804]ODQ50125.1 PLP-dependent transferase [Saitoella complicata NRRL Y-17804]GAO49904.1 hypothetical protein G7K_4040-t1 [Saitoella complicata NRRL Y-17804]